MHKFCTVSCVPETALLGQGDGLGLRDQKRLCPPDVLFLSSSYRAFCGRFPQRVRSGPSKEGRRRLGSTGQGDRGEAAHPMRVVQDVLLCRRCFSSVAPISSTFSSLPCFGLSLTSLKPIKLITNSNKPNNSNIKPSRMRDRG